MRVETYNTFSISHGLVRSIKGSKIICCLPLTTVPAPSIVPVIEIKSLQNTMLHCNVQISEIDVMVHFYIHKVFKSNRDCRITERSYDIQSLATLMPALH